MNTKPSTFHTHPHIPTTTHHPLKTLLKQSSWLYGSNFIAAFLAFLHGLIVARWLQTETYGLLAFIVVYVTITNQILDFRIYDLAVKYISEFRANQNHNECLATIKLCYLTDILTGLVAFFVILSTASLSSRYIIRHPEITSLLILYAFTLLLSTANNTSSAVLSVFTKFNWLSFHSVFSAVTKFVLVLVFLLFRKGLPGVIVAHILAAFFSSVLLTLFSINLIRNNLRATTKYSSVVILKQRFREMRQFVMYTNVNELLSLFTKNADIIILSYFQNATQVGYYHLAKLFVGTLSLLTTPLNTTVYPTFVKLWAKKEIGTIKTLIRQLSGFMSVVILPISVLLTIGAPLIIEYTVGIEFLPSVAALRIMIWGVVIGALFSWVRPILLAIGRPDILAKGNTLCAASVLVFSLLLVPRFGYIGSAIVFPIPWVMGVSIGAGFFLRNYWSHTASEVQI